MYAHRVEAAAKAVRYTVVPNTGEGVATQLPELFEDGVGLKTAWGFEGVGFGGRDEARFGGQALVVDLGQSLGHHEQDEVRQSEQLGG